VQGIVLLEHAHPRSGESPQRRALRRAGVCVQRIPRLDVLVLGKFENRDAEADGSRVSRKGCGSGERLEAPGGQELGGCGREPHQEDRLGVYLRARLRLPRQTRREFAVDQLQGLFLILKLLRRQRHVLSV
jgi:hypothetical protein